MCAGCCDLLRFCVFLPVRLPSQEFLRWAYDVVVEHYMELGASPIFCHPTVTDILLDYLNSLGSSELLLSGPQFRLP